MSGTAEWVSAIAETITGFGALIAAFVAIRQLRDIACQSRVQTDQARAQAEQARLLAEQTRMQGERERQWQTIAVCQKYFTDPILVVAKRAIWNARDNGTKDRIDDPQAVRQDAIFFLNFLDSISIGVRQGVYIKDIVKDNLGQVMVDAVTDFIDGKWGEFRLNRDRLADLIARATEFRAKPPRHKNVG